jgi:uncharacterized protein
MTNLKSELNAKELNSLDELLLARIDEEAYSEEMDEGVLSISELDGLFTAVVSGPTVIAPSQWIPVVWGDFEPVWDSEKEFEAVFSLMIRHLNSIASMLMNQPQRFEPLFMEHGVKGKTRMIVDEWCEGYMRGVSLATIEWEGAGGEMTELLLPIMTFASETGSQVLEKLSETEIKKIQRTIVPSVHEIHAWWLAQRESKSSPIRRSPLQVGRNDPCSCGSGKKYKKCCLH